MKFLCVPCDSPMKLIETRPPERGSVSLVYSCPECAYEFAMLTNPFETQLVSSLGVKVGPGERDGDGPPVAAARAAAATGEGAAPASGESKCPFSGMVREMTGAAAAAEGFPWSPDAKQRLDQIPDFVRPMAKLSIEKYAKEKGYAEIDDKVLTEAREFFGM